MANYNEPDLMEEEDDDGYSIPKILVAVLLLVLIGAGVFIMNQNRELKTLFNKYEAQKKSIENELDAMILKYNMAVDDNGLLSDELQKERDRIIRVKDSIKKSKDSDMKSIEEFKKTINTLKQESSIDLSSTSSNQIKKAEPATKVETPESKTTVATNNSAEEKAQTTNQTLQNTKPATIETKTETAAIPTGPQSFERVEIPPVYPGCSGSVTQQKACFNQKVKTALNSNFNSDIIPDLGLNAGTHRVFVAFTVDKFGNVTNIKAKGGNAKLESEAVKAAKGLPKMSPARQNGIPVDVTFNIPMTIMVQ